MVLVAAIACGEAEEKVLIMENGKISTVTWTELEKNARERNLSDTMPIQHENGWIPARNHPRLANILSTPPPSPISEELILLINGDNPGERIDLAKSIPPGKTVIVDFYSAYCGPCMEMAPQLEDFVRKRPETVLRKVDVNRAGVRRIDWHSPVIGQFDIRMLPYLQIYGPDGALISSGEEAEDMIRAWPGGGRLAT